MGAWLPGFTLTSIPSGLRPLDEQRRLECRLLTWWSCVFDSMDPEGRRYIRELRFKRRTAGLWQVMALLLSQAEFLQQVLSGRKTGDW